MSINACVSDVNSYGFSVDLLSSHYLAWVKIPFYVVVSGWNEFKQDFEYGAFRSAKRGDPKYSQKTLRKFGVLERCLGHAVYFKRNETRLSLLLSPDVFVTLTYDRALDIQDAWRRVGVDFNRWISGLRRKWGGISVVRAFESHEDGYPHIHAVLRFKSVKWAGFPWVNKDGKNVFLVQDVDEIKAGWPERCGFADVELCNSAGRAAHYISKYVSKSATLDHADNKGVKTLAMSWYFHKRAFSISGAIVQNYRVDLIEQHLSNSNGSSRSFAHFKCLDGTILAYEVVSWKLYGVVRGNVDGWGGSWADVSKKKLVELEETEQLELRSKGYKMQGV